MRWRTSYAGFGLIGCMLTLAILPASNVAAAPGRAASPPDVTALFGRALKLIRATKPPTYARAVVYEVDEVTRARRGTKSASGIVKWRFVFDNYPSRSRFASATVSYGPPPKKFGKVTGYRAPFLEDRVISKAPRMTLRQAVTRLQRAGYRKAFFNVTLRNPLGPRTTKPLYIFGFANGSYVAVNTVTKKVAPIS